MIFVRIGGPLIPYTTFNIGKGISLKVAEKIFLISSALKWDETDEMNRMIQNQIQRTKRYIDIIYLSFGLYI
jgi:hypothetical protein